MAAQGLAQLGAEPASPGARCNWLQPLPSCWAVPSPQLAKALQRCSVPCTQGQGRRSVQQLACRQNRCNSLVHGRLTQTAGEGVMLEGPIHAVAALAVRLQHRGGRPRADSGTVWRCKWPRRGAGWLGRQDLWHPLGEACSSNASGPGRKEVCAVGHADRVCAEPVLGQRAARGAQNA